LALGFAVFGIVGEAPWRAHFQALLLAGALCAVISYVDRLTSLSFGASGLKAELRAAIDDANATVSQLHELGAQMGTVMVNMLSTAGLWASDQSFKNQDRLKAQILQGLAGLDLAPSRLAEVSRADKVQVARNYVAGILAQTTRAAGPTSRQKVVEYQRTFAEGPAAPGSEEVGTFVNSFAVSDPIIADLLADYRYYEEHGQHRRPAVWSERYSWMFVNG
jgi:hypothetical protein